ncbi:hypothetical protein B0O99DRAFT_681385 [Bisporella sp. PMI_857]|nr:hypothetical protein B0O99DRAFT_681385 [Bisporella sp. PMI_857]
MHTYPSPNAGDHDNGTQHPHHPFYPNPGQAQPSNGASSDELLVAHLNRSPTSNMNVGVGGNVPDGQVNQRQDLVHHSFQHHGGPSGHSNAPQMHSPSPVNNAMIEYRSDSGGASASKRSKTSRACDECRRKKVKCEFDDPGDLGACKNCKRINSTCAYTRPPQKRGPSKGYIKELSDRVDRLEGGVGYPSRGMQAIDGSSYAVAQNTTNEHGEPFPADTNLDAISQKRRHSSISADFGSHYPPRPQLGYANHDPRRTSPPPSFSFAPSQSGTSQHFKDLNHSPAGLQPLAVWKPAPVPEMTRQSSSLDSTVQADQSFADTDPTHFESLLQKYHILIHPTYPVLFSDNNKTVNLVSGCPQTLKSAFWCALSAALQSLSGSSSQSDQGGAKKAARFITDFQYEHTSELPSSAHLVHLQTTILLAIEAEARGPVIKGPSYSEWLGTAIGLSHSLHLHVYKETQIHRQDGQSESEDDVRRRLWWILVIMDRWHAASTAGPIQIPEQACVLHPEDQMLLKDKFYHLARLSLVAGDSLSALGPSKLPPFALPNKIIINLLRGEIERCREGFPVSFQDPANAPLIHFSHRYLWLQLQLLAPDTEASVILDTITQITDLLSNEFVATESPLARHVACLATQVLVELSRQPQTRELATAKLETILKMRVASPFWDASIKEQIRKSIASFGNTTASQHALVASQGLQHLAELATASTGDDKDNHEALDTVPQRQHGLMSLLQDGYVSRFSG